MINITEVMGSNHSRAYAEVINLIALAEHHRVTCNGDCGASLFLVKKTVDRLINYCWPQEKQDIILKITEFRWC